MHRNLKIYSLRNASNFTVEMARDFLGVSNGTIEGICEHAIYCDLLIRNNHGNDQYAILRNFNRCIVDVGFDDGTFNSNFLAQALKAYRHQLNMFLRDTAGSSGKSPPQPVIRVVDTDTQFNQSDKLLLVCRVFADFTGVMYYCDVTKIL